MDRIEKALSAFKRVFGEVYASPFIPTRPVPAARHGTTRSGHVFYPKRYRDWRRESNKLLKMEPHGQDPIQGPVAILTEVIAKRPKKTHRLYPVGDNDNFEKSAWDTLTRDGRYWHDDDQVVCNLTVKRYARRLEQHGVRFHIFQLDTPNEAI